MTITSQPENEFALVPEIAAVVGIEPHASPPVSRKWVNVSAGGHVSGVAWYGGGPRAVLIHDQGGQARDLDRVALLLGGPSVVLDVPGAGRSSGPAPSSPRRGARSLAEGALSFARDAHVLAGFGTGALAAIATASRLPAVSELVLVGGLPSGADGEDALLWDLLAATTAGVTVLADPELVLDILRDRRPDAQIVPLDPTDPAAVAEQLRRRIDH